MRYGSMASLLLVVAVSGFVWAKPTLTHTDVFVSGKEGYHTFRIPSIVTAPDGSLVAVVEGRKYNAHDPGFENNDIDLVSKRSTDGGKTWSKLQVIDDPGERWSACNPTMVADRTTGRIWLFYCRTRPGRS
ncbi:MAG TPA: sialidase family protein, partial [Candidatus Acidoferrales bacterium]|nr:sialidase family protein [Candidatus Acidoferrales bacterium]